MNMPRNQGHLGQFLEACFFVSVVALAVLGLVFLLYGTLDFLVVRQCERYGYWQTGQTRVVCAVERSPKVQKGSFLL